MQGHCLIKAIFILGLHASSNKCLLGLKQGEKKIVLYCMFIDCTEIVQNHSEYKIGNTFEINLQSRKTNHDPNILQYITIVL